MIIACWPPRWLGDMASRGGVASKFPNAISLVWISLNMTEETVMVAHSGEFW